MTGEALTPFIDLPVAVVVFPVAGFGGGEFLSDTDGVLSVVALACTEATFSFAVEVAFAIGDAPQVWRVVAFFGESIDFSVAVIVFVVAGLLGGGDFTAAGAPESTHAGLFASAAGCFACVCSVAVSGATCFAGVACPG